MRASDPLHLRLSFLRRVPLWFVAALFLGASLFAKADAWAESVFCFPNSTIPNSSIPIAPLILYLTQTGGVNYKVSLCTNPTAPVTVSTSTTPTGKITVDPSQFVLTDTVSKTVSVALAPGAPLNDPFTATIVHSVASDDPNYDFGSTNVPTVAVNFLPPLAVDDAAATEQGAAVGINVLANDLDRYGKGLTRAIQTNAGHGLATLAAANTIQYVPNAGFSGIDSFAYRITDLLGNTDTADVTVLVASDDQTNPQVDEVDPEEGGVVDFSASYGTVEVEVPAGFLDGTFPPGTNLVLTFAETVTPVGDVNDPPPGSSFTGIAFDLRVFVDGNEIDLGNITERLVVTIQLSSFDPGGARVLVAVWNGTTWSVDGIEMLGPAADANLASLAYDLRFSTTVFGEFGVFVQHLTLMPALNNDYAPTATMQ